MHANWVRPLSSGCHDAGRPVDVDDAEVGELAPWSPDRADDLAGLGIAQPGWALGQLDGVAALDGLEVDRRDLVELVPAAMPGHVDEELGERVAGRLQEPQAVRGCSSARRGRGRSSWMRPRPRRSGASPRRRAAAPFPSVVMVSPHGSRSTGSAGIGSGVDGDHWPGPAGRCGGGGGGGGRTGRLVLLLRAAVVRVVGGQLIAGDVLVRVVIGVRVGHLGGVRRAGSVPFAGTGRPRQRGPRRRAPDRQRQASDRRQCQRVGCERGPGWVDRAVDAMGLSPS